MLCQNANPRDPPCLPLHTIPEGILRLKMIPLDLQILLLLKWDLKVSTTWLGYGSLDVGDLFLGIRELAIHQVAKNPEKP